MAESAENTNTDRAWELYQEIGTSERHFNNLEHQYRLLASTWLLGTFAAVGYILTNVGAKPDDWLGSYRELIVAAIAFAGATGITLVWILDLRVYQQLLQSYFLAGLDLEDQHEWLPPIRHNMRRTQKRGTVVVNVAWFYIGCTTILLLIGGASLSLWFGTIVRQSAGWTTLVIALGITCAWAYAIRHKSVSGGAVDQEHELHGIRSSSACRGGSAAQTRVPRGEAQTPP